MAGSGEWVDSWLLLSHRIQPDVENGRFQLLLEVGSRRWGGATWELDLDVGHFNAELGRHDGAIAWELRRHTGTTVPESVQDDHAKLVELMVRISAALAKAGRALNQTDIQGLVHRRAADVGAACGQLHHQGHIDLMETGKAKWYSHKTPYLGEAQENTTNDEDY